MEILQRIIDKFSNKISYTFRVIILLVKKKKRKMAKRLQRINRFSAVQSLSLVQLFVTPETSACRASLSIANSQSLFKLMSIESVMPSNHLILCSPLLLPSIFPSIRVFSNESVLCLTDYQWVINFVKEKKCIGLS